MHNGMHRTHAFYWKCIPPVLSKISGGGTSPLDISQGWFFVQVLATLDEILNKCNNNKKKLKKYSKNIHLRSILAYSDKRYRILKDKILWHSILGNLVFTLVFFFKLMDIFNPFPHTIILQQTNLNIFCQK